MRCEVSRDKLTIDDETITPPYPVEDDIVNANEVILVLGAFRTSGYDDPDFEIPAEEGNVLALDGHGQLKWVIEPVSADDEAFHHELWTIQDHYLTRHTAGNVRFDPETGDVLEVLSRNQIPLGDEVVELSGDVSRVVEFGDAIFLGCKQATHELYAFETDGTERWRSDAGERRGYIFVEDGELWEQTAVNRTTDHRYRLDPETGERSDREVIDTGLW